MSEKVIDFKEFKELKENYIREIEKKAIEECDVVKVDENMYVVISNFIDSKNININFIEKDFFKDEKLKNDIYSLEIKDGDYISFLCKEILDDNKQVVELVVNEQNKIGELTVRDELIFDDREALLNMIAYLHRDKQFYMNYYLHEDFEFLEDLTREPIKNSLI